MTTSTTKSPTDRAALERAAAGDEQAARLYRDLAERRPEVRAEYLSRALECDASAARNRAEAAAS